MLYHFLVPLAKDHILFNVFRYLTFRSFMALISGLVISLLIGPPLIQKLRELKHGGETIREDTPERHRMKKGTPTMGDRDHRRDPVHDPAVGESGEPLRVGRDARDARLRAPRRVGRPDEASHAEGAFDAPEVR